MNINFELVLFYAVFISGLIAFVDIVFLAKKRKQRYQAATKNLLNPPPQHLPIICDYARAFFPILLAVFLIRSFLYEPFRIPSGSLEPTLQIGDFILVNKSIYGLRLPVLHSKIFAVHEPQRGDIVIFRWPPKPSIDYIKRIIGVPGDKISYIDKVLYVNGKEMPQILLETLKPNDQGIDQPVYLKEEMLFNKRHSIYQNVDSPAENFKNILVPDGMYFAMGDNRDDSSDSRFWGFIPEANIIGRADLIWMSWDSKKYWIRFNRLFNVIH